ncbi:MAG: SWIM zinc finger family protein [Lachnospiraceae bacterium]|nr:SWIM zinc finger family protein [Lachnospiraceae bacterium]
MGKITEQQVVSMAPNSAAVANARKISSKGGFVSLAKTEDDTFYMGECKGSGKSNYTVSVDFIEPENPVCRCSCPSRQFPCKHGLALLFEIVQDKTFAHCELPETIREKREKKEKKAAKALESKEGGEEKKSGTRSKKTSQAARIKKMKKQLEGLGVLRKMVDRLLEAGLGTLTGQSLKSYRDLAKQFGDYYLPGPQILLSRLIAQGEAYQKDGDNAHHEEIMQILVRLNALMKKSESYLTEKIEKADGEDDDSVLYEELGGIWTMERLQQLGQSREQVDLLQLAFYVYYDDARKEWIDKGYYVDVKSGEIVTTLNYCPVKAMSHVKRQDSVFGQIHIPQLTYYPGKVNPRVRWEWAEYTPLLPETLAGIRVLAEKDLSAAVKQVKNVIKNPLDPDEMAVMIFYERIGILEGNPDRYVMEDASGNRIILHNAADGEDTLAVLKLLREPELFSRQVLFGKLFYHRVDKRMYMQPLSLITEENVVRLAY